MPPPGQVGGYYVRDVPVWIAWSKYLSFVHWWGVKGMAGPRVWLCVCLNRGVLCGCGSAGMLAPPSPPLGALHQPSHRRRHTPNPPPPPRGFNVLLKVEFAGRTFIDCGPPAHEGAAAGPDASGALRACARVPNLQTALSLPADPDASPAADVAVLVAMLVALRIGVYVALRKKTKAS